MHWYRVFHNSLKCVCDITSKIGNTPVNMYSSYKAEIGTKSTVTSNMDNSSTVATANISDSGNSKVEEKSAQPRKDFKSAIIIMPPEEKWEQMQTIRVKHDKAYVRWMPHVNMIFPFLKDDGDIFEESADKLSVALKDIDPFSVKFTKESFSFFKHKKSCTLWLNPLPAEPEVAEEEEEGGATGGGAVANTSPGPAQPAHPSIKQVQTILEQTFPMCDEQGNKSESGFTPHLSVGTFHPKKVADAMAEYCKDWQTVQFDICQVYLISRKDFHDPFHIRYAVPLGGGNPKLLNHDYVVEPPTDDS